MKNHYVDVLPANRYSFMLQISATKWVQTLHPKGAFWHFPDFTRAKYSFSSPIPSIQCCATVRATFRKQQTPQLWMEGTGEGCGFFCSLKLPYLSTISQQFCCRLSESRKCHTTLRKLIQFISLCWDVKPLVAFYLLRLTSSCLF